ncbi:MAG: hypothetical protein ABIK65_14435 [Candidatus Eisenbacteria bacterium]
MLSLLSFSFSFADAPIPPLAVQDQVLGHVGDGGATGLCSVVYYDYCSGWIWVYFAGYNDVRGVVFDLPADCGKEPGAECVNTHFWWYWRFTNPNRSFVNYRVYEVDSSNCVVGEPLYELLHFSPWERWNYHEGFGSFTADRIAIVAEMDGGACMASDNNLKNQAAGCGEIPLVARSFRYVEDGASLCPPIPIEDPLGPVDLMVEAGFDCQTTSTESASWGSIKGLFR